MVAGATTEVIAFSRTVTTCNTLFTNAVARITYSIASTRSFIYTGAVNTGIALSIFGFTMILGLTLDTSAIAHVIRLAWSALTFPGNTLLGAWAWM